MERNYRSSELNPDRNSAERMDDMTKRRVAQLNSEIKIEKPDDMDFYAKKAMHKSHHRKYR